MFSIFSGERNSTPQENIPVFILNLQNETIANSIIPSCPAIDGSDSTLFNTSLTMPNLTLQNFHCLKNTENNSTDYLLKHTRNKTSLVLVYLSADNEINHFAELFKSLNLIAMIHYFTDKTSINLSNPNVTLWEKEDSRETFYSKLHLILPSFEIKEPKSILCC